MNTDFAQLDRDYDQQLRKAFGEHCVAIPPEGEEVQVAKAVNVPALRILLPDVAVKSCYDNTMRQVIHLNMMHRKESARYVLGRVYMRDLPIPIEHAFLWFDGAYYDLTLEVHVSDCEHAYISKLEFNQQELAAWAHEVGYPPMWEHWARRQLEAANNNANPEIVS